MALSAFKSTSKRGNYSASSSSKPISSAKDHPSEEKKILNRRSRSVSAVSRGHVTIPSAANVSASEEFLNKRDNPLYCCSSSSASPGSETSVDAFKAGRRGRSVSRSSGSGSQNSGNRSLSRVDTGRRLRSVSREHYRSSERELEHGYRLASSVRNKENGSSFAPNGQTKSGVIANELDVSEPTRNLRTWTSQHPISESWDTSSSCAQARNWEDGFSAGSFSEAEEATIRAVCEQTKSFPSDHPPGDTGAGGIYETVRLEVQRAVSEIRNDLENAIQRKNPAIITAENIVDIPTELVNPDAIELVTDIRREYATKLEQSQERARKLRADLAVEEQRGQELSRILKEILPAPKSSDTCKSRPKRKASIERLRMSRRLADEAMNYFDECVSISTFDSSDFSSLEDQQPSSVVGIPPLGSSRFFPSERSTYSVSDFPSGHVNRHEELDNQTQCSLSIAGSDMAISSSCSGSRAADQMHSIDKHGDLGDSDTAWSGNFQFSFACEPMEAAGVHDVRHYIKKFEKELRNESLELVKVRSSYNPDDYDLNTSAESLLFDNVILRNRIESGGLLVCNIRIF